MKWWQKFFRTVPKDDPPFDPDGHNPNQEPVFIRPRGRATHVTWDEFKRKAEIEMDAKHRPLTDSEQLGADTLRRANHDASIRR